MTTDESWLGGFQGDTLTNDIIKIQAFVRGQSVRQQMKEVRLLYEEIVRDIDGPEMAVDWSRQSLSCPLVRHVKRGDVWALDHELIKHSSSQSAFRTPSQLRSYSTGTHGLSTTYVAANSGMLRRDSSMVSVKVQTDTIPYVGRQLVHVSGLRKEYPGIQVQTCEDITGDLAENKQATSHSSQVQTDDNGLYSSLPVKDCSTQNSGSAQISDSAQISNRAQISNGVDVKQFDHHLSSVKTDGSYQRTGPRCRACTSVGGVSVQGHLVDETVESGRCSDPLSSVRLVQEITESARRLDRMGPHISGGKQRGTKHRPVTNKSTVQIGSGFSKMMDLPDDADQLINLKNTVAMELLWVQQAINSRKHYLRLREQLH